MAATDCIFCKIAAKTVPAQILSENEDVVAFLDAGPLADGHALVIPRSHHERFDELPPSLAGAIAAHAVSVADALLRVTGVEGYNVLINRGAVAGQVVPHVHMHLIPRRGDDGLGFRWNASSYPEGKAAELADAYRKAMSS